MIVRAGNLFESGAKTLVNPVNCAGAMGKGIALEFKRRYPKMFEEYRQLCRKAQVKVGQPYLYTDPSGISVLNFPTKQHWRSPSELSYITAELDYFVENYQAMGITSIAFPALGCGNGGLPWETVRQIMCDKLEALPIDIEIYAPSY